MKLKLDMNVQNVQINLLSHKIKDNVVWQNHYHVKIKLETHVINLVILDMIMTKIPNNVMLYNVLNYQMVIVNAMMMKS